jgi:hypothetical protein
LHTDSDFAGFVVGEMNAGPFKNFLYLEDRGEISFHNSFILLDPLKGRQADTGGACELTLAPAKERSRGPYLGRISHRFAVFSIRS